MADSNNDQLRDDIRRFLQSRPDLKIEDLVHCTRLSASTGRSFMTGSCRGGAEVVGELRSALAMARAGEILQPGGRSAIVLAEQDARVRRVAKRHTFYQTQTVKRVAEVLDYCSENAAIGVVTAGFGAGKTEAVTAWRQSSGRGRDSVVIEFDEFSSSNKMELLGGLCRVFGLPETRGGQFAGVMFRRIIEHLREHPTLLIFDQCETVRARCFQLIRQLWDRTREAGVGVVILSAPVLLDRLNKSGMADLGALTSRVGIWAPLQGVTRSEMAAIIKQEGVAEVDEAAFDLWWRRTSGSMRRLMATVDLLNARHAGKRVTPKTIDGLAGHLWGMTISEAA